VIHSDLDLNKGSHGFYPSALTRELARYPYLYMCVSYSEVSLCPQTILAVSTVSCLYIKGKLYRILLQLIKSRQLENPLANIKPDNRCVTYITFIWVCIIYCCISAKTGSSSRGFVIYVLSVWNGEAPVLLPRYFSGIFYCPRTLERQGS